MDSRACYQGFADVEVDFYQIHFINHVILWRNGMRPGENWTTCGATCQATYGCGDVCHWHETGEACKKTANAAIVGYRDEILTDQTVQSCEAACRQAAWGCKSFDMRKSDNSCELSSKCPSESDNDLDSSVPGLKIMDDSYDWDFYSCACEYNNSRETRVNNVRACLDYSMSQGATHFYWDEDPSATNSTANCIPKFIDNWNCSHGGYSRAASTVCMYQIKEIFGYLGTNITLADVQAGYVNAAGQARSWIYSVLFAALFVSNSN